VTKKKEQAVLIFEKKIFRRIYGAKYEDGEWKSRTNRELKETSKGENIVKWIKGQRISWLGHLERMEEDRMSKKIFTQQLKGTRRRGIPRKGWREELESAGSEKVDRVGDRQGKIERYSSTGQSPQRAIAPTEEEEEEEFYMQRNRFLTYPLKRYVPHSSDLVLFLN
jgi:hypothetical protein